MSLEDFHTRLHTDKYYEAINTAAESWTTREKAIADLQRIAEELTQLANVTQ